MTDVTIAPAYDAITESMVLDALNTATIHQLAKALDPGAFKGGHGPAGFRCPYCQAWSAQILDGFRWSCSRCDDGWTSITGQRTRLALRAKAAESYEACLRLVQDTGTRKWPERTTRRSGSEVIG